ncbi:hypothetical protein DM01DRAFT_1331718 [Hesseltinella vesiculosa]|uniref:START domain-containing protein n=1 Tax=Hesseltinella vesiculosa TaxID=101127 RepID=A0A1X2GW93_9FUNG|nr:hypothetical protein DM01DRAFT_1331718 [Hesseltinella vesiculosa]
MDWEEGYPPIQYGASHQQRFRTIFSDDEEDGLPQRWKTPSAISLTHSTTATYVDPLLSSTTYHIHQAENALSTLKHIVMEDGWKKALKHKSGVVVHMKNGLHKGDKTPIFKGEAVVHGFSPQSVFYVIGMRKLWDEQYEDGNLVENLNETTSLTYEVTKPTATSKSRDFALVERIECTQNGSIIFAATSVDTPRLPRIQGRTRAHIKLQGWILEPIRSNGTPATKVTYVIQETMKGWVPGFAKKSLARRPLVIALINDYLQKKSERVRAQSKSSLVVPLSQGRSRQPSLLNPFTPSLTDVSKQSGSHSPTPSQRSVILGSTVSNTSISKKRITFASQDTTFPTSDSMAESLMDPTIEQLQKIPTNPSSGSPRLYSHLPSTSTSPPNYGPPSNRSSQATALSPAAAAHPVIAPSPSTQRLYSNHRHPSKKAQCLALLKQLLPLDQWQLHADDGQLRTFLHPNKFIRVEGVIEGAWTPEQVCSTVQCSGARKIWDDGFQQGDILERFSQKDYLVRWSLMQGDSFTLISTIETDAVDGAIISASTSVEDPHVPPGNAQLQLAGWLFVPIKGRRATKVSLIIDKHAMQPAQALKGLFHYLSHHGCPPYIRRVAGKVTHEQFDGQTHNYAMEYIAKHEPSASYRARKPQPEKNWCTDVRVDLHSYRLGYDLVVSPQAGTRVEVAESYIKVYTSSPDMEGKKVLINVTSSSLGKITCNGAVMLHTKAESSPPTPPEVIDLDSSSNGSTPSSPLPSSQSLASTTAIQPSTKDQQPPSLPPSPLTPKLTTPTSSTAPVHPQVSQPPKRRQSQQLQTAELPQETSQEQPKEKPRHRDSSLSTSDDLLQNIDVPNGYVLVPQNQVSNLNFFFFVNEHMFTSLSIVKQYCYHFR